MKMEYFSSCWYRNISENIPGLYTRKNVIFRQLLVPKYFGEYWFAFSIIHAVNTHENIIFLEPLVPKYFGEYWFVFHIISAAEMLYFHVSWVRILFRTQSDILQKISAPTTAKILQHQQLPKYSIFMCFDCAYYSEGRTIFSEIFRHQRLPKHYILMCIECEYYSEGKAIFSEIFRHQQLLQCSIFMCIDCTYYTKGRATFSEIFRHQQLPK